MSDTERKILKGWAMFFGDALWEGSSEEATDMAGDRPVVVMEATPEGVGPLEEWMVRWLNEDLRHTINKYGYFTDDEKLGKVITAIRRVLDAGKGGA